MNTIAPRPIDQPLPNDCYNRRRPSDRPTTNNANSALFVHSLVCVLNKQTNKQTNRVKDRQNTVRTNRTNKKPTRARSRPTSTQSAILLLLLHRRLRLFRLVNRLGTNAYVIKISQQEQTEQKANIRFWASNRGIGQQSRESNHRPGQRRRR